MSWEYKTFVKNIKAGHVASEILDQELNEAGAADWELVSVTTLVSDGQTTCLVHHFRKPAERKQQAGFRAG